MQARTSSYRFGDLVIASDVPIDLPPVNVARCQWTVRTGPVSNPRRFAPYHTWSDEGGRPIASFTRAGNRLIVDFEPARFSVDASRRTIVCHAPAARSASVVGELLAHDVLPLVIGTERLTLHASAVARDGQAMAFAGASGSGKSTLSVRLAQRGWLMLTDDVAIVDAAEPEPAIVPMGTPIRLWPDSVRELIDGPSTRRTVGDIESKRAMTAAEARIVCAQAPIRLRTLFLLGDTDGSAPIPVEPHAAVAAVLQHAFVLVTDRLGHAERLFNQASHTVQAVRVYRLARPAGFEDLDRVIDSALELALQG